MSNNLRIQFDFFDWGYTKPAIIIPSGIISAIGSPQLIQFSFDRVKQLFFIKAVPPDAPELAGPWWCADKSPYTSVAESYDLEKGCYRFEGYDFMTLLREYIPHAETRCVFSAIGTQMEDSVIAFAVKSVEPDVDATIARIAAEESRKKRRAKLPFRLDEYTFLPEIKSRLSTMKTYGN